MGAIIITLLFVGGIEKGMVSTVCPCARFEHDICNEYQNMGGYTKRDTLIHSPHLVVHQER